MSFLNGPIWLAPLLALCFAAVAALGQGTAGAPPGGELLVGVGRVEVTDRDSGPVHDPLYVKALVFKSGTSHLVLVTVDAVSLGEIGRIPNSYLGAVREALQKELGVAPGAVIVNASHCHGVVRKDIVAETVGAVRLAWKSPVPARIGVGRGHEDRIQQNRRLRLKDGSEADVRRAYSMPRDEDVAAVGPIDPEIGILKIERLDGAPLAVLYQFACHPIQGAPTGGNTADYPAFASRAIEESLGRGAVAFFIQGCAGDINPVLYKDVHRPKDSEPQGNLLGLSVLRELPRIETRPGGALSRVTETLALPRGADLEQRIAAIEAERARLVSSLSGTSLSFKAFMPLYVQHRLDPEYPSYYADYYLHEAALGRSEYRKMDDENRADLEAYRRNIDTMEKITRLNTNLALLKMHLAQNRAAGKPTVDAEVNAVRIGDFVMVTCPGELTVEIGLHLKKVSPHKHTFVSGYTNGYLYYTPTASQRRNTGYAQEDCDCLVAPDWEALFHSRALELLKNL